MIKKYIFNIFIFYGTKIYVICFWIPPTVDFCLGFIMTNLFWHSWSHYWNKICQFFKYIAL